MLFAEKDKAPKQIIIGVNMAKTRKKDTYFNVNNGKFSFSNKNFYQFINNEVIFEIKSTYKTSPFISMIGEGTSASLITCFLGERTPLINSYICVNLTFSNFISVQIQAYNLMRFQKKLNTFYCYTNNFNIFSDEKQTIINQLQKEISRLGLHNFNIINDTFNAESSISAISKEEFNKNVKDLSPIDAIIYLETKYLNIEFLFGSNLGIRKQDVFAVEKIITEKENGDQLLNFGLMILKLFPNSPLGEYYIGRFYEEGENIKKAIYYYKIGFGKMNPSDPNADAFYENILRLGN